MSPTPWFKRHGPFRTSTRTIGRWTIIEVSGKFTVGPPEVAFTEVVDEVLSSGSKQIVVDLTRATLAEAADEWLHYIEHDRERKRSTVTDYKHMVDPREISPGSNMPPYAHLSHEAIDFSQSTT